MCDVQELETGLTGNAIAVVIQAIGKLSEKQDGGRVNVGSCTDGACVGGGIFMNRKRNTV